MSAEMMKQNETKRQKRRLPGLQGRVAESVAPPVLALTVLQFFLLRQIPLAGATEISWQANHDHDHEPAKTAPRSQKYWDEHNIQQPDYAKTDSELWAEQSDNAWWMRPIVGFVLISFVVGMAAGLFFLHQMRNSGGDRLGGDSIKRWSLDDEAIEDKIRSARLERFQSSAPKED
jgi:hypothetical protein